MILIGTGGWSYLEGARRGLKGYSRYFRMVEVNSTFYSFPSDATLRRWREQVPRDFVFTVKAPHDITHRLKFAALPETFEAISKLNRSCEMLDAAVVVFQCPPSLRFTPELQRDFKDLFSSVKFHPRVAVEPRSPRLDVDYASFISLLDDLGLTQVFDVSCNAPRGPSDLLYTRIFGCGIENRYQLADDEISRLHEGVHDDRWKKAFMVFHTIGMYGDAARMQNYEENRSFLPVSKTVGLDSVLEVVGSGVLPAWRKALILNHGWKLCDWTERRRVRLSDLLEMIPERLYLSSKDLGEALAKVELP